MINLENVSKSFKIYKKESGLKGAVKSLFKREVEVKVAVDNLSLDIEEGEMVGYIGSNGAGKSTTIKMMTGILVPSVGVCKTNGLIAHKNRQKNANHIGVVFGQRTQLWWDLPLTETFLVLKDIYEIDDDEYSERIEMLKDVLGLDEFIDRPVRTLSLGQRMRADLAAALIHNPKILFLDEPTIGLDVVVKEKIRNAIKQMNKKYHTTVLLTTHDLSDIEELCERIIIIDKGKKVYDGKIGDIKQRFGYMRTLEMCINESINISYIKNTIKEKFNLSDSDYEVWLEAKKLSIRFNGSKIKISDLVACMMSEVNIMDMSIKETDIETIVKQIYEHEVEV